MWICVKIRAVCLLWWEYCFLYFIPDSGMSIYTLNSSNVSDSQSNIVEFLRSCTASHYLFRVCFSTAGWYMLPTCTYRIVLIINACLAIFVSIEIQLKCYFFLLFLYFWNIYNVYYFFCTFFHSFKYNLIRLGYFTK